MAAIACIPLALAAAEKGVPKTLLKLTDAQEDVHIVCFGDSITGCYYHTGGRRAWPEMLKLALGQTLPNARIVVHNAGKSGHTSSRGLGRIQADVLDKNPDLVVVMFGMNDLAYGEVPADADRKRKAAFRKNLESIVTQCRERKAEVILCTQNTVYPEAAPRRPPQRIAEFAGVIRDLGEALEVPVVDICAEWHRLHRDEPTEWRIAMSETIHPSLEGHRRMAERIAQVITGKKVSLSNTPPSLPALGHVSAQLRTGKPVDIIAFEPVRECVLNVMHTLRPDARISHQGNSLDGENLKQLEKQARSVRNRKPDLVVISLPPSCLAVEDEEEFIRTLSWTVDLCLPFAGRPWDAVAISPNVLLTAAPTQSQERAITLFHRIVAAHDIHLIDRPAADGTQPRDIIRAWLGQHLAKNRRPL